MRQAIDEGRVGASSAYLKKEHVRERLQALIVDDIASGKVNDEGALRELFDSVDMSLRALRMVPLPVWEKMAKGG